MSEFERCLRYGRKEKKMTQNEVAEATGLKRADIIDLESGRFVPLGEDALTRIACVVGMEKGMFLAMYRAEFRQELSAARTLLSGDGGSGPDSLLPAGTGSEILSSDLIDIGKEIMSMPNDVRTGLVAAIRMLVRTQSLAMNRYAS